MKIAVVGYKEQGVFNLPSKPHAAAVAHAISQNLARQNGITRKDGAKFLLKAVSAHTSPAGCHLQPPPPILDAHHLIHMLGQIGNVEICRRVVSLSLETRIEGLLRGCISSLNRVVA